MPALHRREVLFHEGDPADSFHLLASGRVAVRVATPAGDIATLVVLGSGAAVGEMALLDHTAPRSATVVALEPTETWAFPREQFHALRRSHPIVDRFVEATLAAHVRRLSNLLLDALYVPVDKRVARRLCDLEACYRSAHGPTEIPLTQEDLATLAGTSRGTVNRVLRAAAADGLLQLRRGRVLVLDRTALTRRAG